MKFIVQTYNDCKRMLLNLNFVISSKKTRKYYLELIEILMQLREVLKVIWISRIFAFLATKQQGKYSLFDILILIKEKEKH